MVGVGLIGYFLICAAFSVFVGWIFAALLKNKKFSDISIGRWAIGGIIVSAIFSIIYVIAEVSWCKISTIGVEGVWVHDFTACADRPRLVSFYATITAWQAGIAATLALLIGAWVAYFNQKPEEDEPTTRTLLLEIHEHVKKP